ncbi:DUF3137 domain-containing protein [Solemya velum gill symbiont]|uniref:DUF3137 domain-containing protein n=1 Tax=Solemya velum gill symbiont TaxID=2340 RepID=UPI0009CC8FA2|nr:DUF3137 domain-containing protein [Solemya velum gill symbiont]OOY52925.1 hypothetical protein BOV97_04060 [Solemya velum gill symbiont]OOY56846.1 hypothetical protein BOV99_03560 [Solemya velum gill symbiont]OOY58043.1 hypothetical protein BOW00_04185 [Solemya velum gill symbiont]OOY60885.1 hypothetical protein BOW02_04130 [Solemya velum gill symbiont]OOY63286.1 hypothetical protein BOW04_01870 [Solemya velum gill symbiont]
MADERVESNRIQLDPEIFKDASVFESESIELLANYRKKSIAIRTTGILMIVIIAVLALRGKGFPMADPGDHSLPFFLGAGIIALMGILSKHAYRPVRRFKQKIKFDFGNRVLWHYGDGIELRREGASESEFRYALKDIAPQYDRYSSEDLVKGEIKGTDFQFYEVELQKKQETDTKGHRRTSYKTVFRGHVLSIHLNRQYQGYIRIKADSLGNRLFPDKDLIRLESPEFEKLFDVYADDQISSRTILTPSFMERLTELAQSPTLTSGRKLNRPAFRATIKNDYINLMIKTRGNRFDIKDDGKQVHLKTYAMAIQEEMKAIIHCIEGLKLEQT